MAQSDTKTQTHIESKPFVELSEETLRSLRAGVTDTLASLGLAGVKPTLLSERLGLDKTLAWKLSRFVRAPDPLAGARHLPGRSGMDIVVRACAAAGAATESLDGMRTAIDDLDRLITDHAGDRATFDVLIGHVLGADEAANRKQLFKAAAGVLGVQARVQLLMAVLAPSRDAPDRLDVAHASGFIDLQRLRPDLAWIIRRSRYHADDEGGAFLPQAEALDPGVNLTDGPPLVHQFCSPDLPPIHRFPAPDGFQYDELTPGRLGRSGAVTCIMGEITRSVASHVRTPENRKGTYTLTVRTPVEHVLLDLAVHRDAHHAPPRLRIHSLFEGRPAGAASIETSTTPVESLGAPPTFQTPASDAHSELASLLFERAGWDPRDFEAWRVAMPFPPAPCDLVLECELTDEP